ncbi:hypothetical protein EVAR_80548_1 [Eumeta japonica]|uniref:Uncharacterized protein n=1 Tax=Eumeta variegata TaxID=151549 RepID=A0A4C1TNE3_EUMVA|nr:hypothetical protein EVAR_80548_1 [Eumeta japonica]
MYELFVKCLLYADDQVTLLASACGLQMVNITNSSVEKRDMQVNVDRFRNSDVRERCGLKEDVVTIVERGILRWFGHLEGMNEIRLKKQIYRANVCDGKIGKGHPRKSYADLQDLLHHHNASPHTATQTISYIGTLLAHPPYSPNLRGKWFTDAEKAVAAYEKAVEATPKSE